MDRAGITLARSVIVTIYGHKLKSLMPLLLSHGAVAISSEYTFKLQPDLEEMEELSANRQELMDRIQNIMKSACEYRSEFDKYIYLWADDRNEFMRQFLLYNHVLTTEEIEANAEDGVPESPPTLDQFKEQVNRLLYPKRKLI